MKKKILFLLLTIYVFPIHAQEIELEDNKNLCVLPGSIAKFKEALRDAKLHYYTNEGKTKLDLKKAELECNLDYFKIKNGKMVLISSGEKKDRIEIRQDKNLSLNDYSALFFSAIIEKVPSSEERKGVTIGQIHNDTKGVKRPLLRVEVAGGNDIRVVVTNSYLKGEGKVIKDSFTSFSESDTIECKIEINESGNKVTVSIKNLNARESMTKTYKVSSMWQKMDGQFYFKAGAYTQVAGPKTTVSYDEFKFIY